MVDSLMAAACAAASGSLFAAAAQWNASARLDRQLHPQRSGSGLSQSSETLWHTHARFHHELRQRKATVVFDCAPGPRPPSGALTPTPSPSFHGGQRGSSPLLKSQPTGFCSGGRVPFCRQSHQNSRRFCPSWPPSCALDYDRQHSARTARPGPAVRSAYTRMRTSTVLVH